VSSFSPFLDAGPIAGDAEKCVVRRTERFCVRVWNRDDPGVGPKQWRILRTEFEQVQKLGI
jgi:hypothetical protein